MSGAFTEDAAAGAFTGISPSLLFGEVTHLVLLDGAEMHGFNRIHQRTSPTVFDWEKLAKTASATSF